MSHRPYRIRMMRPADRDRVVQLCAEHAAFERADFDAEGKSAALNTLACIPGGRLTIWVVESDKDLVGGADKDLVGEADKDLVGEADKDLVGFAACSREVSTWQAREYLHLDCLYLRPEARRLGLGRELLQRLCDLARDIGIEEIQWQTPSWNRDAVRFYEGLGAEARTKLRFTWPSSAWA